jgi:hypothetical protein
MLPSRSRWLAAFLIFAFGVVNWAYLAFDCSLDLAPDEAHYWDWSRQLDWSYYSKGPLVAWLIHASCWPAGDATMLAVRLPALFCGMLLLAGLYVFTVQSYHNDLLALLVVLAALTLPPIWVLCKLMTIDAPYLCLWTWALVLGHQALFNRSACAWPVLGLVIGLGILAKYTMALFLPSLALFLLTSPEHRKELLRPGFWIMVLIAGLMCLPMLMWNIQNDWVSFRHVNALAGMEQRSTFHPLGPAVYLGQQLLLLLGGWFVLWLLAMWTHRPWREADACRRYLWWLSAPMFGLFLLFSFKTGGGEINWPVAAYLSGLVLAAGGLGWEPGWQRRALLATATLGVCLTALLHFSDRTYPWLAQLLPPTHERPLPLRRVDPTCRLRGWQTLAQEMDRVRAELRAEGIEPVLAGTIWWLPGELAFYCEGQPTVYCFGPAAGSRTSQYDLWRPSPLRDPANFYGRTFILVGDVPPTLAQAFERMEEPRQVCHFVQGQPVSSWQITVAIGFRGCAVPRLSRW